MERKIMVEVTEEELKELNKKKTLDDRVDDLINCLAKNKPDKVINNMSMATGKTISNFIYETDRFKITLFSDGIMQPQIKIEDKEGNRKWN